MNNWTLDQAVDICRKIEPHCEIYGCHIALTGGTLYKDGPRKDVDLLFYRIRQIEKIDIEGLLAMLKFQGISVVKDHGWVIKSEYEGKSVDLFFPERIYDKKDYQCSCEYEGDVCNFHQSNPLEWGEVCAGQSSKEKTTPVVTDH